MTLRELRLAALFLALGFVGAAGCSGGGGDMMKGCDEDKKSEEPLAPIRCDPETTIDTGGRCEPKS